MTLSSKSDSAQSGDRKISTSKIEGYRRPRAGTQPNHLHTPYASCIKRAPSKPLIYVPHTLSEITGPLFEKDIVPVKAYDLTRQHAGEPLGQRIIVTGRVMDENGRPARNALIEVWQANAAGRYVHKRDQHDAPLDPNFSGRGQTFTDSEGRYRFITIRPGEYPWSNHYNAWRPAHIHFSVFGTSFVERLITQMYFPGDPLLVMDPIYQSIADRRAAELLVARFDMATTVESWALGYVFDIVLGGAVPTPVDGVK